MQPQNATFWAHKKAKKSLSFASVTLCPQYTLSQWPEASQLSCFCAKLGYYMLKIPKIEKQALGYAPTILNMILVLQLAANS